MTRMPRAAAAGPLMPPLFCRLPPAAAAAGAIIFLTMGLRDCVIYLMPDFFPLHFGRSSLPFIRYGAILSYSAFDYYAATTLLAPY